MIFALTKCYRSFCKSGVTLSRQVARTEVGQRLHLLRFAATFTGSRTQTPSLAGSDTSDHFRTKTSKRDARE